MEQASEKECGAIPRDNENQPEPEDGTQSSEDPNLVKWDADDPENPRNWSVTYKCWITFQLGMLALAASLGSSITSPAGDAIAAYLGVSSEVSVLSVSLYVLVLQYTSIIGKHH